MRDIIRRLLTEARYGSPDELERLYGGDTSPDSVAQGYGWKRMSDDDAAMRYGHPADVRSYTHDKFPDNVLHITDVDYAHFTPADKSRPFPKYGGYGDISGLAGYLKDFHSRYNR